MVRMALLLSTVCSLVWEQVARDPHPRKGRLLCLQCNDRLIQIEDWRQYGLVRSDKPCIVCRAPWRAQNPSKHVWIYSALVTDSDLWSSVCSWSVEIPLVWLVIADKASPMKMLRKQNGKEEQYRHVRSVHKLKGWKVYEWTQLPFSCWSLLSTCS